MCLFSGGAAGSEIRGLDHRFNDGSKMEPFISGIDELLEQTNSWSRRADGDQTSWGDKLTDLLQVQGDCDPVELAAILDAGTLPPSVGPIDGVGDWMAL